MNVDKKNDRTALGIAQALLDDTESAIFEGDFEKFAHVTALPLQLETFGGSQLLETNEALKALFQAVVKDNNSRNITSYQRDLKSAEFSEAGEIKFAYVTRRLSGHMLVDKAYPNIAVARQEGGVWKVASAQHAVENSPEFRETFDTELRGETISD